MMFVPTVTAAVHLKSDCSGAAVQGILLLQPCCKLQPSLTISRTHPSNDSPRTGGAYSGNQPSSAIGMSMHSVTPPAACVGQAGGMPSSC